MRSVALFFSLLAVLAAQTADPSSPQAPSQVHHLDQPPVFRVSVVAKTTKAINYRHRSGATKIDFRGTALMPQARGEAKVESKQGYIEIEVEFKNLQSATQFGAEYLTYVMWAITPEGRSANLGELLLNGNRSKLNVTTELQVFGLIVTAEPYFAVTQPSDLVVMENEVRADTKGKIEEIDAKYELLRRGQYRTLANPLALSVDRQVPLEIYEARNAVQIARSSGAAEYASDSFQKSVQSLQHAEDYLARKLGRKPVAMMAREAVQTAEDARSIAVRRREEERLAQERRESAEREALAKAAAEEEAKRRAQAESEAKAEAERRAKAEAATAEAEQERLRAELKAAQAAADKAEAEAARANALLREQQARAEADRLRQEADDAHRALEERERERQQAEQEKARLREWLLRQFNAVLETHDSSRGFVLNIPDSLFETGNDALRPLAREKLARLSGVLVSHPGLTLEAEGHINNTEAAEFDETVSERRAEAVRQYLLKQGIPEESVTARAVGKASSSDSDDGAKDWQQDGRVEIIISGDVIAAKL
jgi:outer membrane protein OmpA-like peptidoglycan-associated protein